MKGRRTMLLGALVVAGLGLAALAFLGIDTNLVYYWNPTELMAAGDQARGATVRLGGLVVQGSIVQAEDGLSLSFRVTDGTTTVPVEVEAVPPAMFRENIGVIVEGTLEADGVFRGDRLLVKHDNEYRAPDRPKQAKVEDLVKTMHLDEVRR